MAPLSYYWIISFIYLVIGKENFLNREISDYYPVSDRDDQHSGDFSSGTVSPDFFFS